MKRFRRLLAFLLASIMILAMGMSALAAEGEGEGGGGGTQPEYSITVENKDNNISISGREYTAYKLFDLTLGKQSGSSSSSYDAYAYSINSASDGAWAWDILTGGTGASTGENGVITNTTYGLKFTPSAYNDKIYIVQGIKDGDNALDADKMRALADALQSLITTNMTTTYPYTVFKGETVSANAQSVTISINDPGYYVVYSEKAATVSDGTMGESDKTVVAAVALTSTDPTATIQPKVSVPTLEKKATKVTENGSPVNDAVLGDSGGVAVAKIGSIVSFEIDSVVPDLTGYQANAANAYTFKISDTLTSGLTFSDGSLKVTIGEGDNKELSVSDGKTDYTLNTSVAGKTFELTIPQTTLDKYKKDDKIVVTYDARVNENSLNRAFDTNSASLSYSNSPYAGGSGTTTNNETPTEKVYIVNMNIDVHKITKTDSSGAPLTNPGFINLSGAKFKLYREITTGTGDDATTTPEYYVWSDGVVAWTEDAAKASEYETGADGKFTPNAFRGLDQGTYYLLETLAPAGYNLLDKEIKLDVTAAVSKEGGTVKVTYTAKVDGKEENPLTAEVTMSESNTGSQPSILPDVVNETGTLLPATGGMGTTIFYIIGSILVLGAGIVLIVKRRLARH